MSHHPYDDLESALTAMLGDRHLDVQPRGDAVDTVLAGVGRARRRRATGYAAVATLAIAGAIGGFALTGGDSVQTIVPVVTPTTSQTPTPTATSNPPASTAPASTAPSSTAPTTTAPPSPATTTPTDSTPPSVPVEPTLKMLGPTGIGDVALGATLAEAYGTGTLAMYDPATKTLSPWDGSGADSVCAPAGQAQRTTEDSALVWMDDSAGVVEIAIWPASANPDVQTVEGLRLGDELDRVLELYPDARRDDTSPLSVFFYVENWGGSGNTLTIRDDFTGTVQGMSVVVPGHGGCYE